MNIVSLSDVKKAFGGDTVFENVSFLITENDKIGLVGVNGAGKTTLFKTLTGEYQSDAGFIAFHKDAKIAYMSQDAALDSNETVWGEVMTVFEKQIELEKQIAKALSTMENGHGDETQINLYHKLNEEYELLGGAIYKSLARGALFGMGFCEEEFAMPLTKFSGGQKTRVHLCKVLLTDANLLMLDEPTNHLDIDSVKWLEDFLANYKGSVFVISHDRYFLDRVTNKTFEMQNGKVTVYDGNYSRYLDLKAERKTAMEKKFTQTQKEIKRIEGIIEQQKQFNRERNYKTIASKQKQIDRLADSAEKPENDPKGIKFAFNVKPAGANEVLVCDDISKRYGEKTLLKNSNLEVRKSQRVFLLGANGSGKSTLLKIIMEQVLPDSGSVKTGPNIDVGYYEQQQVFDKPQNTVAEEISDAFPKMNFGEIRQALAIFGFYGDDFEKEISVLSGGEKARVSLLKLMLSKANFLILDEPTNHLDLWSREALENALSDYEGSLLIVSHDRYFINKAADVIYSIENEKLVKYNGNYEYYLEKKSTAETVTQEPVKSSKNDYLLRKEQQAKERKEQARIKRCEEQILAVEDEIKDLEAKLLEFATDYLKVAEISEIMELKKAELDSLYEELFD